ncbi:MAG: DUF1800 domain-containing protein [Actinomycetota bacterium]
MAIDPTPRNAAHLWRRAAFGATPEQIDQTTRDGIEATVASMFDHRRAVDAGKPVRGTGPQPFGTEHLNTWFLHLAVTSPTPAIERLVWFWHGHFATNIDKFEGPELFHSQLTTFRRHGMGRFDDLLKLMARDPAMMLWLDLQTSVIGRPNENYARELMELFTLGVDGGYTQRDVAEVARAFTGYHVTEYPPPVSATVSSALHDDGVKEILGRRGRFTGDDVVDLIVERAACHRFVAGRFWTRYAGTEPPTDVLDDLAAALGRRLIVHDLVTAMFTHPAFYADEVQSGLIAQPVETVANALRGFGARTFDVTAADLVEDDDADDHHDDDEDHDADDGGDAATFPWIVPLEMLDDMGQVLAHPPNVGGWPHNEPWIDATRSIGRLNAAIRFADEIVEADTAVVREIVDAAGRGGSDVTRSIMAAFGHVEWSPETEAAIRAAIDDAGDDEYRRLTSAITIAFTSPEVTLS